MQPLKHKKLHFCYLYFQFSQVIPACTPLKFPNMERFTSIGHIDKFDRDCYTASIGKEACLWQSKKH